MNRGMHLGLHVLFAAVVFLLGVRLRIDCNRMDDATGTVERYTRLCRGVAIALDFAAQAADHGDHDLTRNALAWPGVLDGCAVGGSVDTNDLSWCYSHGDTKCAARELRAIARLMPAR